MKTTSTLLCLLFSVALTAQVTNLPTVLQVNDEGENAFSVVPKQLSYDGSNRVYIRTADDQVAIYGNDFTPVKAFNITPTYHENIYINKERTVTVTVTPGELISSNVVVDHTYTYLKQIYLFNEETQEGYYTYDVPASWTENDMKTYLENQDETTIVSVTPHPEGGWVFVYDMEMYQPDGSDASNYFMVETYGKQYPCYTYLWQNGFLYYCHIIYREKNIYAEDEVTFEYGEWVETGTEKYEYAQDYRIGFLDYDSQSTGDSDEYGDGLCLSQTLFNTDDKYEYLSFPHELSEEYDYGYNEPTPDHYESGTYTENKTFYKYSLYKSFNIMSEDGTILQTVTFPNGFEMTEFVTAQIIQLAGEFYILCQGEMNDNETLLIYKINRSSVGASVEQVCAPIKVGAFPSIANRNQMITIQLSGDNAGSRQTNLQVVDMQGKVMNQQTIPAGQTSTTIPAHRLSNGMNLIKITQGSKTIGTEKVIIK